MKTLDGSLTYEEQLLLNDQLMAAIEEGNAREVAAFLEKGANVNAKNSFNNTPLHIAASTMGKLDIKIIKLLLEHGADIYAKNNDKNTPLHQAMLSNQSEAAALLRLHEADAKNK